MEAQKRVVVAAVVGEGGRLGRRGQVQEGASGQMGGWVKTWDGYVRRYSQRYTLRAHCPSQWLATITTTPNTSSEQQRNGKHCTDSNKQ